MLTPLPPSPTSSPPPESSGGSAKRQKENGTGFHITLPSGPLTPEDRGDFFSPPRPLDLDFTTTIEDDDEDENVSKHHGGSTTYPAIPREDETPHKDTAEAAGAPRTRSHTNTNTPRSSESSRKARDGAFPRISRPVELMRDTYDYVVIGTGYGGAVAAPRLARSLGKDGRASVCVLERGRERWPGEYPARAADALGDLHVSGEFAPGGKAGVPVDGGDPMGMYHLVFGRGMNAVVGNGEFWSLGFPVLVLRVFGWLLTFWEVSAGRA